MTQEQLKAAIKAKGYTIKAFAEVLGIAYGTLRRVLSGNKPLTEQLRRHIMLALQSAAPVPDGQAVPVNLSLTLPPEIWRAIDQAAAAQGITPAKYTSELVQRLAKDITAGLIHGRAFPRQ